MEDQQRITRDLADTISWCSSRIDAASPGSCFRTSELRPKALDPGDGDWLESSWISEVVESRRGMLQGGASGAFAKGRLLVCAYEYTNHNGLTCVETNGYFDIYDNPPWDTWVGEVDCLDGDRPEVERGSSWPPTIGTALAGPDPSRKVLLAWVPSQFQPLADDAIEVECVGMLAWLDALPKGSNVGPDFREVVPPWLVDLGNARNC